MFGGKSSQHENITYKTHGTRSSCQYVEFDSSSLPFVTFNILFFIPEKQYDSDIALSLSLSPYHLMKARIRKQNLHLPESYLISWIMASERTLRVGSAGSFAVVIMPCRGTGVSPTRALEKTRDLFMLSNCF